MIRFKAFSSIEPSSDYAYQQDEEGCHRCDHPVRYAVPCDIIEVIHMTEGAFVVHPDTYKEKELVRDHPGYMGLHPLCPKCARVVGSPYVMRGYLDTQEGFVPAYECQMPSGLTPDEEESVRGHLPWVRWVH